MSMAKHPMSGNLAMMKGVPPTTDHQITDHQIIDRRHTIQTIHLPGGITRTTETMVLETMIQITETTMVPRQIESRSATVQNAPSTPDPEDHSASWR